MLFIEWPDVMRDHPVFRLDSGRIPYTRYHWPYMRQMIRRVHITFLVAWLLITAVTLIAGPSFGSVYDLTSFTVLGIGALSWLAGGFLDVVSVQTGAKLVSEDVLKGRWDLLRLTPVPNQELMQAKHAAARLRVWTMTAAIASVRLTVLSFGLITLLFLSYASVGQNYTIEYWVRLFLYDPINTLIGLLAVGLLALVYVLEPFWRAQAMTALGLLIATRVTRRTMAMLAGFALTFVVWLAQGLMLGVLLYGIQWMDLMIMGSLHGPEFGVSADWWPDELLNLLYSVLISGAILAFLRLIETISLGSLRLRVAESR